MAATLLTFGYSLGLNGIRFCYLCLLCLCVSPALRAQSVSCPIITNTGLAFRTVCTEKAVDSLQVVTTATPSDEIEFVRFDSLQANPYTGYGAVRLGDALLINGKATLRTVSFPAHWGKTDRVYYVYARLKHQPVDPACTPFALTPVFVQANPTASLVVKEATCYGSVSQQDGQVSITGFDPADTYERAINGLFSGHNKAIPVDGILVSNGSRTGIPEKYDVRITDSLGCYTDRSIVMANTRCDCASIRYTPILVTKIRNGRRSK